MINFEMSSSYEKDAPSLIIRDGRKQNGKRIICGHQTRSHELFVAARGTTTLMTCGARIATGTTQTTGTTSSGFVWYYLSRWLLMIKFEEKKDRFGEVTIHGNKEWISFDPGYDDVCLDGTFTVDELHQIISEIERHLTNRCNTQIVTLKAIIKEKLELIDAELFNEKSAAVSFARSLIQDALEMVNKLKEQDDQAIIGEDYQATGSEISAIEAAKKEAYDRGKNEGYLDGYQAGYEEANWGADL